jgi:hypothetical protein
MTRANFDPEKAIKVAAESLFWHLSEISEDTLEELWADSYPGGSDVWFDWIGSDDCTVEKMEEFQEPIFCKVMLELGNLCIQRGLGHFD